MSPLPARGVAQAATGVTLVASLVLLASCGGGASADAKAIADACSASTNLPPETCECLGDRAVKELTDDERAFVLATLGEETEDVERLRGKLGLEGAMKAGMFMTNAATCAREAAGEGDGEAAES